MVRARDVREADRTQDGRSTAGRRLQTCHDDRALACSAVLLASIACGADLFCSWLKNDAFDNTRTTYLAFILLGYTTLHSQRVTQACRLSCVRYQAGLSQTSARDGRTVSCHVTRLSRRLRVARSRVAL